MIAIRQSFIYLKDYIEELLMKLEHLIQMIESGTCPEGKLHIREVHDFTVRDDSLSVLLEALKKPNNVRRICLSSTISAESMEQLAQFLENNSQVESFELWNSYCDLNKSNDIIESFARVVKNNKTLTHMVLSGVGLEKTDTTSFFKALKDNTTVEYLSLYTSRLSTLDSARQIAEVISHNKTLKTLKLSDHWFREEGLAVIAESLLSNTTLEHLDVSGHRVCDSGASLFAEVLAKDIPLKSIRFFSSEIKAPGATALANSLVSNTHLTDLDLGCDSIGKEGTLALAKALETNRSLQSLKIGVYSASGEGVTAFANMLEKNTSLTEFDYNSFYTSGDGMDKLRIDIGLTRNKIAHLKGQEASEEFKDAVKELTKLQHQFDHKIKPANFSDYVDFRIQMMRAGRRGCCAFPFAGGVATTSEQSEEAEESSENTPTMK